MKAAGPKENVPGTNWSVTAMRKAEITAKLKKGLCHEFRPAGMGQGLLLDTKRRVSWAKPSPVIAEFFGVKNVWTTSTDCD